MTFYDPHPDKFLYNEPFHIAALFLSVGIMRNW